MPGPSPNLQLKLQLHFAAQGACRATNEQPAAEKDGGRAESASGDACTGPQTARTKATNATSATSCCFSGTDTTNLHVACLVHAHAAAFEGPERQEQAPPDAHAQALAAARGGVRPNLVLQTRCAPLHLQVLASAAGGERVWVRHYTLI